MTESVLLNTPLLWVIFVCALLLLLCDRRQDSSGYVLPVLSAVVFVAGMTYALLIGVTLEEMLVVALVFFAASLAAYKGGEKT